MKAKIESLADVYSLVESDISDIDARISKLLSQAENSATYEMCQHILKAGGKRIRPILSLLTVLMINPHVRSLPSYSDKVLTIATAVELIHMASLVHDDVIDNSSIRRNQPSVNAQFGNSKAVTLGVYLYSMSLAEIAKAQSIDCLRLLSAAVKGMCLGELNQLDLRKDGDFTWNSYLNIIKSKTADLFRAACQCGSVIIEATDEQQAAIKRFGHNLGMLFQLTDDYLDYFSDGSSLKKAVGQDYLDTQVTLPILLYMDGLDSDDSQRFVSDFKNKVWNFESLKKCLLDAEVDKKSEAYIEKLKLDSLQELSIFEDNSYRDALFGIVEIISQRIFS